ncbi:MAG: hypothetical protein V4813_09210 [Gemmatimonadota bacterium]
MLHTDRPLPGLPVAPIAGDGQFPFWTLRTVDTEGAPRHSEGATPFGQQPYSSGPVASLAEGVAGPEIVVSDTGRFSIDVASRTIVHQAPPGVDRAAVALDLIGVVLPFVFHLDGAWCMHASAVQTEAGVIAFVATRGTGKSTLAAACLQSGDALVADDVLVLRERAGLVTVTPSGVPLRLRVETAQAVGAERGAMDGWGKVRVEGALSQREMPLHAIYLLSAASADATVERVPRSTRAAALALLSHGKIAELLGTAGAGDALARCVTLAGTTPVYDLAVPRDLARLPAVVQALHAWCAETASARVST